MINNQIRIIALIASYANGQTSRTNSINSSEALSQSTTTAVSLFQTVTATESTELAKKTEIVVDIDINAPQKEVNDWFSPKHSGSFSQSICGTIVATFLYLFFE